MGFPSGWRGVLSAARCCRVAPTRWRSCLLIGCVAIVAIALILVFYSRLQVEVRAWSPADGPVEISQEPWYREGRTDEEPLVGWGIDRSALLADEKVRVQEKCVVQGWFRVGTPLVVDLYLERLTE